MVQAESNPALQPLRAAMEARDVAGVVDAFAPDAVFRSPLTSRLVFTGREQIATLTRVVLDVLQGLRYTDEACLADIGFLAWTARVGGSQEIAGVDQARLGPDGKIRELTVYFRPLPSAALALRLIGSKLAGGKSPAMGVAVSAMTSPLVTMARTGDVVGAALIRSAL
jgi:hypothetical protein